MDLINYFIDNVWIILEISFGLIVVSIISMYKLIKKIEYFSINGTRRKKKKIRIIN